MAKGFHIQPGDTVHCKELVTGSHLSGRFTYRKEGGLLTELFSFGEFVHVRTDEPLYLLTEQLETISLFDSFGGPGRQSRVFPPETLHNYTIHSNIAVSGSDRWTVDDRIKRIGFSVPEAFEVLRNDEKIRRLKLSHHQGEDNDWLVINVESVGRKVRLSYLAQYNWDGEEPREITPRFEIEFNEPILLHEYSKKIQEILSFLSFSMGVRVSPESISISRMSLDEFIERIEKKEFVQDHRILSRWGSDSIESGDFALYGAPLLSHKPEDLESLSQCLIKWLNRSEEWFEAYVLMVDCFSKRREISGERLICVSKWLEKIPTAKPLEIFNEGALNTIIDAAFEAARSIQGDFERQRIAGALRSTKNESRSQHMARLLANAWPRRQLPRPKEEFLQHLKSAQLLRGRAAHGLLEISDEKSFRECARAIAATEALCYMLMVVDLPLSKDGRSRLPGHRAISDFTNVV